MGGLWGIGGGPGATAGAPPGVMFDNGSAVPDEQATPHMTHVRQPHSRTNFRARNMRQYLNPSSSDATALVLSSSFSGVLSDRAALGNLCCSAVSDSNMRFGFVAASLTAHVAVVGLVWRFAPDGLPPSHAPAPSSQPGREIEVTPWEAKPTLPATDVVSPAPDVATPAAMADEVGSKPADPPQAKTTPKLTSEAAKGPDATSPLRKPAPASRRRERTDEREDEGDWLSIGQQLPDARETSPSKTKPSEPERDVLVERLLAKERDQQHLAARDEMARQTRATSEAAPRPMASAAAPDSVNKRAAASVSEEVFGESGARADLWVELTRWLPRAASGDGVWQRLPADSSYEFRVELTTESGTVVGTRVLDRAPPAAEKLLTNTAHLMSRGRYGGTKRAVHRFELRIRLSTAQGRDLWIAHTTPDPPKPGLGSFIAPSGRRFDVWVSEAP